MANDFADRIAEIGLTVETLTHELSPQDCRRYGIVPERFLHLSEGWWGSRGADESCIFKRGRTRRFDENEAAWGAIVGAGSVVTKPVPHFHNRGKTRLG